MKLKDNMQRYRELCFGKEELPKEVLEGIAKENLWNLWVPKSYGGLELSLTGGLKTLRHLAQVDGSLGWTVTLCSGANFFIGNLPKETANEIFNDPKEPVCFGGSGGVFGTAERKGEGYIINGIWKYATGAPYLTHFTLSAKIQEEGKDVLNEAGMPVVRCFVLDRKDVKVIKDWNTMGLKATATHSFEVSSKWVDEKYSFFYNEWHHSQNIFKIPFEVFADLTLWVNYVGMAAHYIAEAEMVLGQNEILEKLKKAVSRSDEKIDSWAKRTEDNINLEDRFPEDWIREVHSEASASVKTISEVMISVYPFLGIRGCSNEHQLNQVFKDYFTATQHHIFSTKEV